MGELCSLISDWAEMAGAGHLETATCVFWELSQTYRLLAFFFPPF